MLRYVCNVASCEYSWCQHPYVCVPCKSVTRRHALYPMCVLLSMALVSLLWKCDAFVYSVLSGCLQKFFFSWWSLYSSVRHCLWHTEMLDLLRTKVFNGRWGGYCWCCCFLSTVYRVSHMSIVEVVQLILIGLFCWKVVLRQTLVNRDTRNI